MHRIWPLLALLALVLSVPAPVAAAPPQSFTATGVVLGSAPGDIQPLPIGFITRGEPVTILITGPTDWPTVAGATVTTVHRSTSLVIDPATGAISGVGSGDITVAMMSGVTLQGRFTFEISGRVNLSTQTVLELHDRGVFTVGGYGIRANGTFTLDLDLDPATPSTVNEVVFRGFRTGS